MKLNKKQKRTATIASMAALLAVVLGMGGQTFAKYIETHTVAADTAVVAKFGFNLQVKTDGDTLFEKNYNGGAISSTSCVVAPGASGSIVYTLNGISEVDAIVTVSFENYTPVYLKNASKEYNPIEWTVDDGTATSTPTGFTYNFPAGSSVVNRDITVSWTWPFEASDATITAPDIDGLDRNKLDTILGNAAKLPAATGTIESPYSTSTPAVSYSYNVALGYTMKVNIEQSKTNLA